MVFLISLTVAVLVSLLPYHTAHTAISNAETFRDSCRNLLPSHLSEVLKRQHPGWNIVALEMLESHKRKLFLKENKGKCPGAVKVDFYGDGTKAYAIVLTSGTGFDRRSRLIIGRQVGNKSWQATTLEDDVQDASPPVVLMLPAGEYKDVYGKRTLKSKNPVVAFVGYESWAIVYSWTGKDVEKVWISD